MIWRAVLSFVIVFYGTVAGAQDQHSFGELARLVASGDRVAVTLRDGDEHSGEIVDVTTSAVSLLIEGDNYVFEEQDVSAVYKWRRDDPVLEGFLFGLGVGAVFGATAFRRTYDVARPWMYFSILAGAGGALGAGVDALLPGRQLIYQSDGAPGSLHVAPVVGEGRRGISFSLCF